MSSNLRVGLLQLDTAWEDPAANIQHIEHLLEKEKNLDLLVLPEMWSTGFTMHPGKVAEENNGTALQWMLKTAATSQMHIAGSISVSVANQYYNRFYTVSPAGEVHHYDKKHLFSYGKEDQYYSSGHQQLTYQVGEWKIRAIVCYDLRFPVWCRNTNDYDVMLVVANWPAPRVHHWEALLRARAIENQSFVIGVNRIGTDGNHLVYNGHSAVYDMNGSSMLEMHATEGVGRVLLQKEALIQFRHQYRFLQDRDHFSL